MAEIKKVEVTGEELERRIRVQLEFSVQHAEEMLTQALVVAVAHKAASDWIKLHKKKLTEKLNADEIAKEVMRAVIDKAVFNLAIDRTQA